MNVEPDHPPAEPAALIAWAAARLAEARAALHRVVFGQEELLDLMLLAVAAGQHALIEGVPGLAKTLAVRTLARVVGLDFRRVQLTPDLLPSDLTGTMTLGAGGSTFRPRTANLEPETSHLKPDLRAWTFVPGPVFTSLLLADEINRTPPKTQVALLEAMAKRTVTVAGRTHALPDPFLVFATQNPIEQQGTYPLSAMQRDRFALALVVPYPDLAAEERLAKAARFPEAEDAPTLWTADVVRALQRAVRAVYLPRGVLAALVELVRATRPDCAEAPPEVRAAVTLGAGPRAIEHLVALLGARALLEGRAAAGFGDLEALFGPAVAHRLELSHRARAEGQTGAALAALVLDRRRAQRARDAGAALASAWLR